MITIKNENAEIQSLLSISLFLGSCATVKPPLSTESISDTETRESLIDEILERGVMKVGLGIFVPWSFKDTNGNLVGFEVDVARQLAKEMGVEVEFVPTAFPQYLDHRSRGISAPL